MIKHRKDGDAMAQAYSVIREKTEQQELIDEKGGLWDKALAKSPIAKAFGGVSQRAAGRVTSKNDSKKMMDKFWATLGRNNKPVSVDQLKYFLKQQVPQFKDHVDSLPALQNMGGSDMLKPRQIKKMMPEVVDQIHEIIAGGTSNATPAGAEDVDPNSMFGAPGVAAPQAPAAQTAAPQAAAPQADIEAQLQDKQEELTDDDPETPEEKAALEAEVKELRAKLAALETRMGGSEPEGEEEAPAPGGQRPSGGEGSMVSRALEKPAQELPGQLTGEEPTGEEPTGEEPGPEAKVADAEDKVEDLATMGQDLMARIPPEDHDLSEDEFKEKYPEEYQKLIKAGAVQPGGGPTSNPVVDEIEGAISDLQNKQKFEDDGGPFALANPDRVKPADDFSNTAQAANDAASDAEERFKSQYPGQHAAMMAGAKEPEPESAEVGGYDPEAPYGGGAAQATVDAAEAPAAEAPAAEAPAAAPSAEAPAAEAPAGGMDQGAADRIKAALDGGEYPSQDDVAAVMDSIDDPDQLQNLKIGGFDLDELTDLSEAFRIAVQKKLKLFQEQSLQKHIQSTLGGPGFMSKTWGNF